MSKVSRNDPCPCGSGKKYKQCCIDKAGSSAAPTVPPRLGFQQQFQLAAQLYQRGRLMDALNAAQVAAKLSAKSADVHHLLAAIYQSARQLAEASSEIQLAIKLDAGNARILFTAAGIASDMGQLEQAARYYESALALQPSMVEAHFNLGNVLRDLGHVDKAMSAFRQAVQLRPNFGEALSNLGDLCRKLSEFGEAERHYKQALASLPGNALIHAKRGLVLQRLSRLDDAIEAFRQSMALNPADAHLHSNLLLASQYDAALSREELFDRHRHFAAVFESDAAPLQPGHSGWHWDGVRPLRIGYVSPDLRHHSVAHFAEPVICEHIPDQFEVHVYYSNAYEDEVTQRIKSRVPHWHDVATLTDVALAKRIQSDAIDILVDLSGHTAGHRLKTFIAKPAPIQVTWLGYPGTTGLSCMDYRLTDECLDPVGTSEAMYTETLIRLPTYSQFVPPEHAVEVGLLPALTTGFVTLACLNNTTKINEQVLAAWSQVLRVLPSARLVLGNANDASWCKWVCDNLSKNGVGPDRVQFIGRLPLNEYLALHQRIDLALDPFPWNGGTTTMLSMWMGVPVVTFAGDRPAARLGASALAYANQEGFTASTLEGYVALAKAWATDLEALSNVRSALRTKMTMATQRQGLDVVRAVEQAYADMARHKMSNNSSN